ncbi:B3 domain-containing protein [Carex littledalei]|uniref:B3 domain-containing protein n=1 Tax=Carex littledalei TaxID=544730 RepID=A0A833VMD8_9POAL|nr:B3 domain-containing protein [Carex littledalei]
MKLDCASTYEKFGDLEIHQPGEERDTRERERIMKGGAELGKIPNKFAKMFFLSENIELEGPSGYTWHVKMMRSDNTFALKSGWKEFVTSNKIYENDILVFTYKDSSSFKVLIFDRSGCEKVASFFAKNMNTEPGKESEESNDSSTRVIASPHREVEKEIISLSSGGSDTDEPSCKISTSVARARTTGERVSGKRKQRGRYTWKLDSVSPPSDLDNAFSCIDLDPKSKKSKEEKEEEKEDKISLVTSPSQNYVDVPPSEFYSFAKDRSIEKFEPGQTWALYHDMDKLPKYYAVVKRVDLEGKTVHITWLEPYGKGVVGEEKRWIDLDLPLGCGIFTFGCKTRYNNTEVFSHKVVTVPVPGKKNVFEIVPVKTETWAVYRNWKIGWSMNDITKKCQYDLVRVSNVTRTWIEVLYLAKVAGYRTVFKLDQKKKSVKIPKGEFVRFSHKIPAYMLSDKAGPNMSGCWELDPAALPESLLC